MRITESLSKVRYSGSMFIQYYERREGRFLGRIVFTIIFALLSLSVFPLNTIGGLGLLLNWGDIIRSIIKPNFASSEPIESRAVDFLVESFGISLVSLAPLAFILPALFGPTDYWLVVVIGCILFSVIEAIRLSTNLKTKAKEEEQNAIPTPSERGPLWIILGIAFVSMIFGALLYIKVTYFSFDDTTFFIKDVALHVSIIQSMSHGLWPIPDLLEVDATINSNPVMMTFGFAFSGVLMALTKMGNMGDVFLIFVNTLFRGYILLTFYWLMKRLYRKIPEWLIAAGGFGLAFGTDIAGFLGVLGFYPWDQYQGIPFQRTLIDGTAGSVSVSSLGADALFLAFHHLPAILAFMFLIGIVTMQFEGPLKYILPGIVLVVMPFYHLGIGLMLAAPILLVLVLEMIRRFVPKLKKKHLLLLTKLIAIGSLIGLYLVRDLTSSIIVLIPRVRFWEVIPSFIAYLGIFSLLLPIAYYNLHKGEATTVNLLLITATETLGLMMLFFSTARELHIGYNSADYYPLMAFQTIVIITCVVGITQGGLPDFKSPVRIRGRHPTINAEYIKLGVVIITVLSSVFTMSMFWSANYGAFHLAAYGNVPQGTPPELEAYEWLYENSEPTDVILIHPLNWEICPLKGRQIISSGYRIDQSNDFYNDVDLMYNSTTIEPVLYLFEEHRVRFVFVSDLEREDFGSGCDKFSSSLLFTLVYDLNGVYIFEFQNA